MYCEKEKECPIYQIHRELNGHYQRLINELLGKGYYNMGMDAYSCNAESCEDMLHEIRRMRKLISTGRWFWYQLFILFGHLSDRRRRSWD